MKYLRFNQPSLQFIVWEDMTELWHSRMAQAASVRLAAHPVSAGFVYWSELSGEFVCHGESESLGMKSAPEDSDLFNKWIKRI